ncbi:hypothetical protein WCT93_02635 [Pectobacterium atrosepticum]|uniref:hypothetical protein n=1 Tax=Pectobacteriaceae TaxID=1903410 RepID=UPI0008FBEB00|nr:hypothetical protein [Dickeya sp. DW 0440]
MLKLPEKAFNTAIWIIVFCSIFFAVIAYSFNSNFLGYLLIFLPLIFSLLITWCTYVRYSKSLKAIVDFIIYIPASIAASLFLLRLALDIPNSTFVNLFSSLAVAFYAYLLAIAVATKCCVAFCDAVFSYKSESAN